MRKEHVGHNFDRVNYYHLISTDRDCSCGWIYLSGFDLFSVPIRQKCSWSSLSFARDLQKYMLGTAVKAKEKMFE